MNSTLERERYVDDTLFFDWVALPSCTNKKGQSDLFFVMVYNSRFTQ